MKFIDNNTVALIIIGVMGIIAVAYRLDIAVATGIIGVIGGYLGGKAESK